MASGIAADDLAVDDEDESVTVTLRPRATATADLQVACEVAGVGLAHVLLVGEAQVGRGDQRRGTARPASAARPAQVPPRSTTGTSSTGSAPHATDHLGGLQHRHAPGDGVLGEGDPVARLQGPGDSAAAAVVLRPPCAR